MRVRPRVLMVTGAYYPELSGGGLQARGIVRALGREADFAVLTTSTDRSLPAMAEEDGVPIRRIYVETAHPLSSFGAFVKLAAAFIRFAPGIDIVNLHGFSRKGILLAALSRLFGKRFVLTLQTGVQDEPDAVKQSGRLAYWAYASADLYLSVSPSLTRAYLDSGLAAGRVRQVCNAVDTERFRPATADERAALRAQLGLPADLPVVLFVGFFSRDKRPDLLYDAWAAAARSNVDSALVLIGATGPAYREIDTTLARTVRERAARDGLIDRVSFVESTLAVDRYFRAADVYVLPSIREGLPIALLEAMASGLPCIATRLPGSTDVLIDDGVNGCLVGPDDRDGFAAAIAALVTDRAAAVRFGEAARRTILERYSIQRTAAAWLAAYRELDGTIR
jgi:glycosyltransferase involved in cell wall biosynthesis